MEILVFFIDNGLNLVIYYLLEDGVVIDLMIV